MLGRLFCLLTTFTLLFCSQAFAAQPLLTVSAKTLSVKINGSAVEVDVYQPMGPQTGAAILTHGGFRGRKTMAEHAQALAARGVLALAPDMPCTFDHRCNAGAITELVKMLRETETLLLRAPASRCNGSHLTQPLCVRQTNREPSVCQLLEATTNIVKSTFFETLSKT